MIKKLYVIYHLIIYLEHPRSKYIMHNIKLSVRDLSNLKAFVV